jgi:hypothetical protein
MIVRKISPKRTPAVDLRLHDQTANITITLNTWRYPTISPKYIHRSLCSPAILHAGRLRARNISVVEGKEYRNIEQKYAALM